MKNIFIDVHRIEFDDRVPIENGDVCHILILVEGTLITVQTTNEKTVEFNYAETFVLAATAVIYILINNGQNRAKVIKAFLK